MAEIRIAAGERRRILHLVSDSIPQTVRFSARPVAGSGSATGRVEVAGSRWLWRKPPVELPLADENAIAKGWLDTLFSIYVTPDQDVQVTMRSRHFTARLLLIVLVAVILLAAAAAFLVPMVLNG